jgi:hypothetical protein
MDIWAKYCTRTVKCNLADCHEPINKGDRMIFGINKRRVNGKTFTSIMHWHIPCYGTQSENYLDTVDYIPQTGGPGRKSMNLNAMDWKRRRKIILRAKVVKEMIIIHVKNHLGKDVDQVSIIKQYREEMSDIRAELDNIGGVPKIAVFL